jgi:hypothetical protein
MRRAAHGWALAVTAAAALLAGCGETGEARKASVSSGTMIALAISYSDGAGQVLTGRLACTGTDERATGALTRRAPAARLCAQARSIAPVLTQQPPARRACTQVYGGPQTLRVTGRIDDRTIDRRFRRTNGCEIADFGRVGAALTATR